jgi:hypothetical protein
MTIPRLFVVAAAAALLALLPGAATATNDVLTFSGQYTAPACGTPFDFTVDSATKSIDVVASTAVVANDIVLKLAYAGGVVAQSDTLTSPEAIHYANGDAGVAAGTYSAIVCPFNGVAAVSPSDYTGSVTISELPLPGVTPPGSTTNPITVTPTPSYSAWDAKFAPATVVDAQRTEGEPIVGSDADRRLWESGPWGFTTTMSFVHRSTTDGKEFHLVSTTGTRPDGPPGGGDTDVATDDQGNAYFVDLEGALNEFGVSVSNDNGNTWRKNPAAVQQSVVDRQWYAVDNGPSASAVDNSVFLAFHETAVGTFIYSSPGSTGPTDPVGGLVFQNSAGLPGPLQALAGDAICAQLRFDPVKRNLYYACNEGDHVRVTVGHVLPGQRTGIQYANFDGPPTPGGGDVLGLFPALATDAAGNVYIAWIDGTNFNLYYAFSTDEGQSWSAAVKVNSGAAATNEFDWAQGGSAGKLALAWYATDVKELSDDMPSMLDATQADEATKYQWYGYAALVDNAATAKPTIRQARFTAKPMHYGNICNSGLGCTTSLTADRTMADFFGFTLARDGGLRVVFNDGTNEFDGAGLFATRQISGGTATGSKLGGSAARDPVADVSGDAQYPHYAPDGIGVNLPQLDLTGLKVTNPTSTTLRVQMTVKDASQLLPPAGKATPLWLTRFQALSPRPGGTANVYRIFYVYMEKQAGVLPPFFAGTASCQGTTPANCKIFQYRGEKPVDGKIEGNTITIDVGLGTGFGSPVLGKTLYNVTAFTFGRNDSYDDLYADVDATEPFDYTLGSLRK